MAYDYKVVITDCDHGTIAPEMQVFRESGLHIRVEWSLSPDAADVAAVAHDADGLLVQYAPITADLLARLPFLKVISRYGVGVDSIDIPAATARHIFVANVPDYCVDEVSNHAIALMLDLSRRVTWLDRTVRRGEWSYHPERPSSRLWGKNLGIIGLGRIGRAVARKMQPFGVRLLTYDPYISPQDAEPLGVVILASLTELLRQSDYVSIHVPLTNETRHMISYHELQMMKPTAFIVNTSRGPVIDEEALVWALREGRIAGAGLDVREQEPIKRDDPLTMMENVILTPHVAFYSLESIEEMKLEAARAIVQVLQGGRPRSLANPEVLQQMGEEQG